MKKLLIVAMALTTVLSFGLYAQNNTYAITSETTSKYEAELDLNNDGKVNAFDMTLARKTGDRILMEEINDFILSTPMLISGCYDFSGEATEAEIARLKGLPNDNITGIIISDDNANAMVKTHGFDYFFKFSNEVPPENATLKIFSVGGKNYIIWLNSAKELVISSAEDTSATVSDTTSNPEEKISGCISFEGLKDENAKEIVLRYFKSLEQIPIRDVVLDGDKVTIIFENEFEIYLDAVKKQPSDVIHSFSFNEKEFSVFIDEMDGAVKITA